MNKVLVKQKFTETNLAPTMQCTSVQGRNVNVKACWNAGNVYWYLEVSQSFNAACKEFGNFVQYPQSHLSKEKYMNIILGQYLSSSVIVGNPFFVWHNLVCV